MEVESPTGQKNERKRKKERRKKKKKKSQKIQGKRQRGKVKNLFRFV